MRFGKVSERTETVVSNRFEQPQQVRCQLKEYGKVLNIDTEVNETASSRISAELSVKVKSNLLAEYGDVTLNDEKLSHQERRVSQHNVSPVNAIVSTTS